MIDPQSTIWLDDLRFALTVMEERSHLGLDDSMATRIRNVLAKQIATKEDSLAKTAVGQMFAFSTSRLVHR